MYALETKNITKRFGTLIANDGINLTVRKGEVRAILGENGAGKTTLMNILYGLYEPTAGEVYIQGENVHFKSPKDAIALGLGMVHQHFMLVPTFTVRDNMILGMKNKENKSNAEIHREIRELFERYDFRIDPNAKISQLPVGIQQRVEIMKAIYRGADILILDEPTAVLIPQEIKILFDIINQLKAEGKSIIFISHKMNEVMEISDTVSVLRLGKLVSTVDTPKTCTEDLCRDMIGRELKKIANTSRSSSKEVSLDIRNISVCNDNREVCKSLSLQVHAGEIVGIAGVDGNGQTELGESLTGLRKIETGEVLVNGVDIANRTPRQIIGLGVAHVPEDRHARGMILDFSIKENMILEEHASPKYTKCGIIDYKKVSSATGELISRFRIKAENPNAPASTLSGGNQQKVILAREISRDPDVLICMKPTRGLDVGAIEYVHQTLLEEKNRGKAILLFSSELEEIMALSDRIAVMYEGEIVGIVNPEVGTEQIGLLMAGIRRQTQ